MLLCCNPGEVTCQVMNCPSIITVWMGDVNADKNYTPVPNGIAFFCETPAVLYNVLNSNSNSNLPGKISEFIQKKNSHHLSEKFYPSEFVKLPHS